MVAVSVQHWRDLLFLHWEVPPEALRALVPRELEIDRFEGRTYVGVVPFLMRRVRARFLPPLPGLADFYEVNVRTYVRHRGGEPGVWFFSLDASNLAAVLAARAGWQLPYFRSRASQWRKSNDVSYHSERLPPGRTPARLDVRYRVHEALGPAQPGTLEHFFVERYLLYTRWQPLGLRIGQVVHQPYPLHRAELLHLDCQSLANADGLPGPTGNVHTLYSHGVDVDVLMLRSPRYV
ncbi:MAG TPA: DUF2071 domain-containing protein [Chloroflexota bacterium]|nr:DUF2071 domain-containing protein [Chloroflexota bacterium]